MIVNMILRDFFMNRILVNYFLIEFMSRNFIKFIIIINNKIIVLVQLDRVIQNLLSLVIIVILNALFMFMLEFIFFK